MNTTVEEARSLLGRAEAEQKQQHRTQLIERLAKVRADIRECRARKDELNRLVPAQRLDQQNAHKSVLQAIEHVNELEAARPACFAFLPDDPECVIWAKEYEKRQQQLEERQAALRALPDPNEAAAESNVLFVQIAQLAQIERNTIDGLAGSERLLVASPGTVSVQRVSVSGVR